MHKGYINLYLMLVILVLLASVASMASITLANLRALRSTEDLFATQYLAEAGMAFGIDKIKSVPGYFTDGSLGSPLKAWLITGSVGHTYFLQKGGFKIVCPSGRGELYSIGFLGNNITAAGGYCFLKIKFEESPFRMVEWNRF